MKILSIFFFFCFLAFPSAYSEGNPSVTLSSISKAIERFKINVPANTFISLDLECTDRGLATKKFGSKVCLVFICPSAFSSWGLLGSTLAHEVEVHCRQNYFQIRLEEFSGLDGIGKAEREAYQHELNNAKRFKLSPEEVSGIRKAMEYLYPVRDSNK